MGLHRARPTSGRRRNASKARALQGPSVGTRLAEGAADEDCGTRDGVKRLARRSDHRGRRCAGAADRPRLEARGAHASRGHVASSASWSRSSTCPTTPSRRRSSGPDAMPLDLTEATVAEIAQAVARGETTALAVTEAALARIAKLNPLLNAFTDVTGERARARAQAIDAARAAGKPPGPLAGVPFAVKNLFDVRGLPTRAGSKINRERAPAGRDQPLIERLEAAGAVLVGALNMGEYAYDFTGENAHDGNARNPHDPDRMTGGSSGGSGGAVAGRMVPLALGSDTNGSIRVPSSYCGLFGLKPTYGRLSRARSFPFVASLDHLGPLARSARDLALAYDAMQGPDPEDPACAGQAGRADAAGARARHGRAAHRRRGRLFPQGAHAGSAGRARPRRRRARRAARDRDPGGAARPRRRLCDHGERGREPASRPAARPRAGFRPGRARPADRRRDDPGEPGQPRAEIPPLVSRARARAVRRGRRDPRPGHARHGAAHRPADDDARRRRDPAAAEHRHLYPADLVHRPAGGGGAGAARADADRRAGDRRAVARGRGAAHRARARTRRGSRWRRSRRFSACPGEVHDRTARQDMRQWRSTCPRSLPR